MRVIDTIKTEVEYNIYDDKFKYAVVTYQNEIVACFSIEQYAKEFLRNNSVGTFRIVEIVE